MKSRTCSLRPLFASFVLVVFGMWKIMAVCAADNKTMMVVNVGVVLDLSTSIGKMALSCIDMSLSDFNASRPHRNTTILLHINDSKGDVIQAAAQGLKMIEKRDVKAILGTEIWLEQLGEKAEVPIISFNDPSISSQIDAICDIIKAFSWTQVAVIYQAHEFRNWVVLDLIEALQAFSRGSPLVNKMSKAVLRVTQSETMNKIQEKWFGKKMSDQSDGGGSGGSSEASSSSLDLSYFSSLFLITASAAILALALYFLHFIRSQRFVEDNPCFWTTLAATLPIFIMKDHPREGRVDADPPMVSAEASPTTNAPLSPSSDSIHSPRDFCNTHSSHHNQASLEIIHG